MLGEYSRNYASQVCRTLCNSLPLHCTWLMELRWHMRHTVWLGCKEL